VNSACVDHEVWMNRTHALIVSFVVAFTVAACGGSNNGGSNNGGGSQPPSGGGTTTVNPCSTALEADQPSASLRSTPGAQGATAAKKTLIDGNPRGRVYEAMWIHQAAEEDRRRAGGRQAAETGTAITTPAPVAEDVGDIAVVQDSGDLVIPAHQFDLGAVGLRFTPNGATGYNLAKIDSNFRSNLGAQLTLGDDDSSPRNVAFSFPFYGASQTAAFVNSDGNITFGEADQASTERDVSRLLTGPPRVALFLADLDPSAGGKIFVNATSDQYTVTWCGVHGFDSQRGVTAQASLLPDGSIEMKYGDNITLGDAVVGLSPGQTGNFTTMDLSTATPASGNGAVGERFAASTTFDALAAARKFYTNHSDNYDQILLWTDQPLIKDAFAYETTASNEITGIGVDIYDLSGQFGSGGRLHSLVVMDWLGKYPDDPTQKFLGENNTLSVMGQEVGHRWLAYFNFRDHTGARSDALLGRDLAHWSFFFNSDASVMEGNQIEDQGGGQFRTVDAVKRYSMLDQYAMGLVGPNDVPSFFYVEAPASSHQPADAPQIGVSFTGTRRDVLLADVIAIHGSRSPDVAGSPKVHRQAFVYVTTGGRSAASDQVSKLDNIRRQWESFFRQATSNRMTAVTTLR
jgi:hypothetical protein